MTTIEEITREASRRRLERMEGRFKAATASAEKARGRRNAAVSDAIKAGLTYQEIADVTGLARSRVGQIAKLSPVEEPRES